MSDGSASQVSSKPRTGVMVASAAALALAVTGGVVAGFVWSGGGPAAVAEKPAVEAAQEMKLAAGPVATAAAVTTSALALNTPAAQLPSLADIVERVSPAVVSLRAKVTSTPGGGAEPSEEDLDQLPPSLRDFFEKFRRGAPGQPRRQRGEVQGSGFVIDPTGYIVTNNHVVQNATEMEAIFADGKKYKAKLIGRDQGTDIALIKIETGKSMPSVTFGDDARLRVGDWVLAVGNPFGLGGTVTAGIISARGRDQVSGAQFTDYLQIDAAINQGNSGGPTFDLTGRVIGMNTAIFSPSGGSVGIGFAIPSSTIQRVVAELKKSGAVTRGWLGVNIRGLDDDISQSLGLADTNGALVADVLDDSPAKKAGIKQGDVVLSLNGSTIKDNTDLSRKVAGLNVGQTADFVVWRNYKKMNISVTIAKRPGEDKLASRNNGEDDRKGDKDSAPGEAKVSALGLGVTAITPAVRTQYDLDATAKGVLITDVDDDSDAAERGLRPGDRIVAVAGSEVHGVADIKAAVDAAKAQRRPSVLLYVETARGARAYVPVKLNK